MKISTHFDSEEFISKVTHNEIITRGLNPQWYCDKQLVMFCEWLREKCGTGIIINNWKWQGRANMSGLRGPKDIGSELSQHKFMHAIDIKVKGFTPAQLRQIVLDNFGYINEEFGITTIETIDDTPTWLHLDKRWTGLDHLLEVNG